MPWEAAPGDQLAVGDQGFLVDRNEVIEWTGK